MSTLSASNVGSMATTQPTTTTQTATQPTTTTQTATQPTTTTQTATQPTTTAASNIANPTAEVDDQKLQAAKEQGKQEQQAVEKETKEKEEAKKAEEKKQKDDEIWQKQKKLFAVAAGFGVLGIILLIIYYYNLSTKSNTGNCRCSYTANELYGIFYAFLFGGIVMIILGSVLAFRDGHKKPGILFMLFGAFLLLSSIVLNYLANTMKSCNPSCGEAVNDQAGLAIAGWISLDIAISMVLYALSL